MYGPIERVFVRQRARERILQRLILLPVAEIAQYRDEQQQRQTRRH